MIVYRIVKQKNRTTDLSGTGDYNVGGRWNNPGIYAVYTSENRALAAFELLVHTDQSEAPPNLFIMSIEINQNAAVCNVKDTDLPENWKSPENSALKNMGDKLLSGNKYLAIKARSAIMPYEYNYILNPHFPRFYDLVKVVNVESYNIDERLLQ